MMDMKYAAGVCVVAAVVGLARADTFHYIGPGADPATKSSFSGTGVGWKSAAGEVHAAPQPGHSYVIDGEKHEPRCYGTVTFNGDALYLNNRDIAFFGGTFTCTNLIAGGSGAFMQTSGAADQRVEGGITVMSGKSLAFWLVSGGALEIASDIVGDGTCYLRGQTANAGMKLNFSGDNSGFTGRFSDTNTSDYKGGQCLRFISTSSWFGNPAAFDAESVRLTNATRVEFAVSQELETPNRGIWIDGGSEVNVYEGCTAGIGAPVKSQDGFAKDGAGTLILRTASPGLAGIVTVRAGAFGGGCRDAFGAAQLSMASGTTLLFCSTNGPLVLAAAPLGTYVLSADPKLLVEGSNDLLDLPESSPADLSKITMALSGRELSARVENGRQIVSVLIPAGALEDVTTFYLRGNDSSGCSSFDGTGAGWTNVLGEVHLSPQSGYDYVIDGREPRTKQSGNTVFSGNALYLSGKDLALCSLGGGAFVCDNLVCNGAGDVLVASTAGTLKGRVTVTEGARLGLYPLNGALRVESAISGTGTLLLKGGSTSRLVGDNSQFFGRCAATGANAMSIESPSAWFGNPPEFDPDSLGWTNAMSVTFNCSLDVNTTNRGVRLDAKSNNHRTVIAVAADRTVTLGLALLAPQGFLKGGAGVLKLAPLSGSRISGNMTAMAGLLGGTCTNAFGGAQLVFDPGANLLFCSTNGPYALAAAPTGTYAIEVEGFEYGSGQSRVKVDLFRLPPGAAFDASKVAVRRVRPERNELPAKLVVRRTDAEVRVSAIFRRKAGMMLMLK